MPRSLTSLAANATIALAVMAGIALSLAVVVRGTFAESLGFSLLVVGVAGLVVGGLLAAPGRGRGMDLHSQHIRSAGPISQEEFMKINMDDERKAFGSALVLVLPGGVCILMAAALLALAW